MHNLILQLKQEEKKQMIEFNGYLTGKSERFFFKKNISYLQIAIIFAFTMVLPFIILLVKTFQALSIIIRISCSFCVPYDSGSHFYTQIG